MRVSKVLLVCGLLFLGCASAFGADNTQVNKPIKMQTLRAGIAVADTAATTLDDTTITTAVGSILNPEFRKNCAVSIGFSNAAATCAVHFVRGNVDGNGNFTPMDQTVTTFTAPSLGKIRSLYRPSTVVYDMEGFGACTVVVEAPSAGTVEINGGVF